MSYNSDTEEADFEDAVDLLATELGHPQQQPTLTQNVVAEVLQSNILSPLQFGPPPPLPSLANHLYDCRDFPSTSSSQLNSPISPVPPPIPPRRPMPNCRESDDQTENQHAATSSVIEVLPIKSMEEHCFGRQRGHSKTNSLDRGLSLAKTMKTGPFPHPCTASKSNSLTRGASPEVLPVLDENDQSAQGVIQGVIQQVLSESVILSSSDKIEFKNDCQNYVNHQSSLSTIAPIINEPAKEVPKKSSVLSKIKKMKKEETNKRPDNLEKKMKLLPHHYENLSKTPQLQNKTQDDQKITSGNAKKRIDEKQHRRSASDKSPTKVKPQVSNHQKSSTWEPNQKSMLFHMDSIDPIARDVERRMSLKEKASIGNKPDALDTNDASSADEVFGQKHTSMEHVRRFARTYGLAASDFLRGTVQKVRQQANNLRRSATRSAKKSSEGISDMNDRDGNSSIASEDQHSIANCASFSESLPIPTTTPLSRNSRALNSAEPSSSMTSAPRTCICRPKNAKKGPFDFEQVRLFQELDHEHTGAIWCIKFSDCGRLLATAGQDRNVRVWVLRAQLNYFTLLRERYGKEGGNNMDYSAMQHIGNSRADIYECDEDNDGAAIAEQGQGKNAANEELTSPNSKNGRVNGSTTASSFSSFSQPQSAADEVDKTDPAVAQSETTIFSPKPFCVFRGHTADVLDLSWAPRNYFLLSGGMDRTVKLWHLARSDCLCSFQHIDFVTCIAFMPKDDRYFISGSMDGKIRLWHIPEKRVAIWNEVEQQVKFITAITFVKNGKFIVVGTFVGLCFFYSTDQLKYHTVIDVRSSRGKNKNSWRHKITSLAVHGDKLLVTSNESRICIYDLRDMDLCCKFKGAQIEQSQIRTAFSPNGKYIISGSEDTYIYIWRTNGLPSSLTVRKDRNDAFERIRAHQTVVTTAVFAPKPQMILTWLLEQQQHHKNSTTSSIILAETQTQSQISINKQQHKERSSSSSVERRPFLAFASKFALPTANLTDIQHIRQRHNKNNQQQQQAVSSSTAGSLGYSSSLLSIPTAAGCCSTASVIGAKTKQQEQLGRIARGDRHALGDVIVTADLSGSLKVFINVTRLQAGSSNFFPF